MRFIYSKYFLLFVGIIVIIFIGLVMQTKGWLQPIEYVLLQAPRPVVKSVQWVLRPFATVATTLGSLHGIVDENTRLSAEVSELRQQQVLLEQQKMENQLLKDELNFKSRSAFNLQSCTILSIDAQNTTDVINLNCGSDNGVQAGQAVVSQGHLIAKVVHVGNLTSSAVLITNAQQSVDAKLSKNNVEGVVKGSFGSGLVFDLVSQSAEVAAGDLVVTAGINPLIPKNILIGEVGQQLSGSNDLFKKLTITSPVKTHAIDYVFVVKP